MKHPLAIVPYHLQTHRSSCTAWGIEVLLLTFEQPLPRPSLQEEFPEGCGFSDAIRQRLRDQFGLATSVDAYGNDFGRFERAVLAEIRAGRYPIFTLPEYLSYSPRIRDLTVMFHAYIAIEENASIAFLTQTSKGMLRLTKDELAQRHHAWWPRLKALHRNADDLLHTLTARLA